VRGWRIGDGTACLTHFTAGRLLTDGDGSRSNPKDPQPPRSVGIGFDALYAKRLTHLAGQRPRNAITA